MVKVHHSGDFCIHIFSDSHYPKLLNATCIVSTLGVGGIILSERV